MKTSWLTGLDDGQKEEVEIAFKSSSVLRKRLKVMLEKKAEEVRNSSLSKEDYNCPNWAYKQADSVGYARAIEYFISLIEN